MDRSAANSQLRTTWEAAAPGWAKWEAKLSENFEGPTNRLFEMAGIMPGSRVIDIACGAGIQTIQAAKLVGAQGLIVATDISPTMLDHVRNNAQRAGMENVETLECSADQIDEALKPFDAAICRFGLMLFPSPVNALKSIRGVLNPGARFSALVFTTPARNPFLSMPMKILLDHAGKQPPVAGGPGLFSLGADGALEELLRESGLKNIEIETASVPVQLSSADEALEMMQQAFGAYRAVVAELSSEDQANAWADVHNCLGKFEGESGFAAELEVMIGSGENPT